MAQACSAKLERVMRRLYGVRLPGIVRRRRPQRFVGGNRPIIDLMAFRGLKVN
jgi:hypothetical protein